MNPRIRIGLGTDVHRLAPGRPCRLGGIDIESPVGMDAVSDGDAVLHAVCDAILGAGGCDDLGTLFPDSDPGNVGRDSSEFVEAALARIHSQRLVVESIDIVIETEKPKIAPHRAAMRRRIAELLRVTADQVNVKGKTNEKLDAVGRGEAVRVLAVALLVENTEKVIPPAAS